VSSDTKQTLQKRVQELEGELSKANAELNYREQDKRAAQPVDPLAQHVASAKALRKFVNEELPNLFSNGNNLGLVPNGLAVFVAYPNGCIYPHMAGTVDIARAIAIAQYFLGAQLHKHAEAEVGSLLGAYRDPELRRMLERGY
jgi:hypothetical protein